MSLFQPPQKRNLSDNFFKGIVLVLEGSIGAGKTTLGLSLEHYFNEHGVDCKFFSEVKDEKMLKLYLKDMEKYAFIFQYSMVNKRIHMYKKALKYSKKGKLAIVDRGMLGDIAFEQLQRSKNFISDEEHDTYLSRIRMEYLAIPHITLHLKMNPELAFDRMIKRGIKEEKDGYTLEYFQQLEEAHSKVFNDHPEVKITEIPWTEDKIVTCGKLEEPAIRSLLNEIIHSEIGLDLNSSSEH